MSLRQRLIVAYQRLIGFILVLIPLILSSCASVSSYQTARTIPSGTFRIFVGAGYGLNQEQQSAQVGGADFRQVRLPIFEGGLRLGLAERWDLGVKVTVPGTGTVDIKHQFHRGKQWEMAVGVGGSYVAVTASSQGEDSKLSANVVDVFLPLYVSYALDPTFAVYANPKYVFRIYPRTDLAAQHLVGSALGFRWGNDYGLFLEGAFLRDLQNNKDLLQGGVAFFIGGGQSTAPELKDQPFGVVQKVFSASKSILVRASGRLRWRRGETWCVVKQNLERACGKIIEIRRGRARIRLDWIESLPRVGDRVVRE